MSKKINLWWIFIFLLIICGGCESDDEKANPLYIKANEFLRKGKTEEALQLLKEIENKYPKTRVAIESSNKITELEPELLKKKAAEEERLRLERQQLEQVENLFPSNTEYFFKRFKKTYPNIEKEDIYKFFEEQATNLKKIKDKEKLCESLIEIHTNTVTQDGQKEVLSLLGFKDKLNEFVPNAVHQAEFDYDDCIIYRVREKTDRWKGTTTIFTLVDRGGCTKEIILPKAELSMEINLIKKVFHIAENNQSFRQLLEYTMKHIIPMIRSPKKKKN